MTIGEKIKFYRTKARITQEELGERIFSTGRAVGHYESGKRDPSLDTLRLLAKALDVSLDIFINEEPPLGKEIEKLLEEEKNAELGEAFEQFLLDYSPEKANVLVCCYNWQRADENARHLSKFFNCRAHAVSEGEKALLMYARAMKLGKGFGFVLLDILMLSMSGHEVLPRIVRLDKNAVVIMHTDLTSKRSVLESIRLGAKHFIAEETRVPFIPSTFTEHFEPTIRRTMEKYKPEIAAML